jgi:hypothetical protein
LSSVAAEAYNENAKPFVRTKTEVHQRMGERRLKAELMRAQRWTIDVAIDNLPDDRMGESRTKGIDL